MCDLLVDVILLVSVEGMLCFCRLSKEKPAYPPHQCHCRCTFVCSAFEPLCPEGIEATLHIWHSGTLRRILCLVCDLKCKRIQQRICNNAQEERS